MSPLQQILLSVPTFVIYKQGCPFCVKAVKLLNEHGIEHKVFDHREYAELDADITSITGHRTYPKIYRDELFVGGCSELEKMLKEKTHL
ncbi:glutaredoxin 3 [Pancytospora philotis]|nr:glutaredoxin 3 [Pancytospora philotis]